MPKINEKINIILHKKINFKNILRHNIKYINSMLSIAVKNIVCKKQLLDFLYFYYYFDILI